MLKIDLNRVPGTYGAGNAIYRRCFFQFFLVCSEQFIPENKYLPEILIKVFFIDGMMYPVMRWRYDDFLEDAHFIDMLRVIPELSKQVQGTNRGNNYCGNTNQCCRNKQEGKWIDKHRYALPQRTCKVEILAAMVNDMKVPE